MPEKFGRESGERRERHGDVGISQRLNEQEMHTSRRVEYDGRLAEQFTKRPAGRRKLRCEDFVGSESRTEVDETAGSLDGGKEDLHHDPHEGPDHQFLEQKGTVMKRWPAGSFGAPAQSGCWR